MLRTRFSYNEKLKKEKSGRRILISRKKNPNLAEEES